MGASVTATSRAPHRHIHAIDLRLQANTCALVFASKEMVTKLVWLQERWQTNDTLPSEGIQVNGDSGNDAELFEVPGVYGCVVSNAMPELAAWADAHPSDSLFRCQP